MEFSSVQKILALDGGGIRGIIPAICLNALQNQLGNKRLDQSFDLLAGTSTGSLLACALGMGVPAADLQNLYVERGKDIFPSTGSWLWSKVGRTFTQGPSSPKYSDKGLQSVLREFFGGLRFGDLRQKTMVVAYDTVSRNPVIFKSWREEDAHYPVWEVCKASCSAPTYFPAHLMDLVDAKKGTYRGALIDGGVVANNPAACAVAEAIRLNAELQAPIAATELLLASFGTGQLTRSISAEDAREWGALEWAIPIIDVLFDGSTDAVDYIASRFLTPGNHFRFQVELEKGLDDLDDTSKTNLFALTAKAMEMASHPQLYNLAQRLKH